MIEAAIQRGVRALLGHGRAARVRAGAMAAPVVPAADRLALSAAARKAGPVLDHAGVAKLNAKLDAMAGLDPASLKQLAAFHAPIYADPALQAQAKGPLDQWVFGGAGKDALTDAYRRVMLEGRAPKTEIEAAVLALARTREARWKRLAAAMDMPVPAHFKLHRGVNGDYAVEAVVKSWAAKDGQTMAIPTRELASWSLDPAIARKFGDDKAASVIYSADVPVSRTLADKWADGGPFVTFCLDQQEVVVATAKDALRIPKAGAVVTYQGKTYTYADREALIRAWRATHA